MAKPRRHLQQSEWGRTLAQLMASSRDCKTQAALARKSGVGQSTIGRIIRGEVNPQTGTMTFLTEALRIPLKTLVEGAMSVDRREVDDVMFQVLEWRKDRKRAEQALEILRRKEDDAIDRLQKCVWAEQKPTLG